jgi:alkylation response protein AidB-like acyl-CoA dehydrogenase
MMTQSKSAPLAAVQELRAVVQAHAAEAERLRTLAPAVVAAIRSSGLHGFAVPLELGGGGFASRIQLEVIEAMTRIDTSAGWSLMISAMEAAFAGAYLPQAGASEVFGGGLPTCAGLLAPSGTLLAVEGGFRVHGRWAFGSGVRHADWIVTTGVVQSTAATGTPVMRTIVVPAAAIVIEDTWHSAGLRGSGSEHYRIEEVFVPEARTFPFPAAAALRGAPIFDLPFTALLAPAHAGFALGVGRAALDALCTSAAKRTRIWSGAVLGTHAAFHTDLGRAQAKLRAARALAYEVADLLEQRSGAGLALSDDDWSSVRTMVTHATEVAVEVATFAFRAAGASALYEHNPVQRIFRDAQASAQHIAATEEAYEFAGRVMLGTVPPHPLLAPRPARPA